jgi:RHS repeat-associated protein
MRRLSESKPELHVCTSLFTGKERDTESGNDYFGARYYGSSMGRFMSPDWIDVQWGPVPVPGADFDNPQSLNLYSYVLNNSLTSTDPDGHDVQVCDANGQCNTISNDAYTAGQKGNNGGLNVPTLNQVGNNQTNGTFNATAITDANGNTVGTATYVARNPGIDPYVGNNMAGYQEIGAANKVVTYGAVGTAVVFGGVAAAAAAPEVAAAIGRQGIKFALEHGMRWEVGHTMVMATASEVKAAIGAAVASGLASGEIQQGIIKGQTMVNGTIIAFTGFMNSAGQITISNVMGGFNK